MDEGRKIRFLRGKGATDVSSRLPSSGIKSRRMSTDLVFPAQVVLAFATIGMLARWYVAPRLAGLPRESALQPLLVVQAFRYIGLGFLAPALVRPSLAQSFAIHAALGTTLAAVLALAAVGVLDSVKGFADRWNCPFPSLRSRSTLPPTLITARSPRPLPCQSSASSWYGSLNERT